MSVTDNQKQPEGTNRRIGLFLSHSSIDILSQCRNGGACLITESVLIAAQTHFETASYAA